MQIEVTEKEAREIYSLRYLHQHRKKPLIVLGASFTATIIAYFLIVTYINEWVALLAGVFMFPALYMTIRMSRASGKYARSQIEE